MQRIASFACFASGPELRNRWPVTEGYRLELSDEFTRRHGKTYLGGGEAVPQPESHF